MGRLQATRKAPRTRPAGTEFADPAYELSHRLARRARRGPGRGRPARGSAVPSRILLINGSPRSEHTCPGEMSKTYRLLESAREVIAAEAWHGMRGARSEPSCLRVRQANPSLQGVLLDGAGTLSLALLLLPQSCHGAGQRLDERHLSDVGRRAWHHDHLPGALVPGARPSEADDGPAGLRRRRQSRSQPPRRARMPRAPKSSSWPVGPIPGTWQVACSRWSCTATRPAPRTCGGCSPTGSPTCIWCRPEGGALDRYIGYYEPYATSHDDLDAETALFEEVRNAVRALIEAMARYRAGEHPAGATLHEPRPK